MEEETPPHAATALLQLLGGSRLLCPFTRGCNPVHLSASSIHAQAATLETSLAPELSLHTPNCLSGAEFQGGMDQVV